MNKYLTANVTHPGSGVELDLNPNNQRPELIFLISTLSSVFHARKAYYCGRLKHPQINPSSCILFLIEIGKCRGFFRSILIYCNMRDT